MIACVINYVLFDFVAISVSFSRPSFTTLEGDGPSQPVLVLSRPLDCCNISVRVEIRNGTALGNLLYNTYVENMRKCLTVLFCTLGTKVLLHNYKRY